MRPTDSRTYADVRIAMVVDDKLGRVLYARGAQPRRGARAREAAAGDAASSRRAQGALWHFHADAAHGRSLGRRLVSLPNFCPRHRPASHGLPSTLVHSASAH